MEREENVTEQPIGYKDGVFFYKFSHNNKKYKYHSNISTESTINGVNTGSSHLIAYQAAVQKLNGDMTGMKNGYSTLDMVFIMQARLMDRKDVKFHGQVRPLAVTEDSKPAITVVPTVGSSFKDQLPNILNENKDAQRIIVPIALEGQGVVSHMTGLVIEPPKDKNGEVKVYYFDPLGNTSTYNDLKDQIQEQISKAFPGKKIQMLSNDKGPELDGKSCGPWSEWFLSEIAANPKIKIDDMTNKCNELLTPLDTNAKNSQFIQQRYDQNKEQLSQLDTKLTSAMKQAGIKLEGTEQPKTHSPTKEEKEILEAMFKAINSSLQTSNISNTKIEREQNGHELVVKNKENKEMFRATSTSVTTKEISDENLKAMSAAIVSNLKERLVNGGNPDKLKITLGDCKPPEVEEKLAKFINEDLKKMKQELKTEKPTLDTSKIQNVETKTPTVKAIVESEDNKKEKQTNNQTINENRNTL